MTLQRAGALLGVSGLGSRMVKRSMQAREGRIEVQLTTEQAYLARDALAKAVYNALFDMAVTLINVSLKGELKAASLFIGLLDVYGFESFETNSFEQVRSPASVRELLRASASVLERP